MNELLYNVFAVGVGFATFFVVLGLLTRGFRFETRFERTLDIFFSLIAGVAFGVLWPVTLFIAIIVCAIYASLYVLDQFRN